VKTADKIATALSAPPPKPEPAAAGGLQVIGVIVLIGAAISFLDAIFGKNFSSLIAALSGMIFGSFLLGFARAIILLAEIKEELIGLRKPAPPVSPPVPTPLVVSPRKSPLEEIPAGNQPYRL
jgi:hypothetical protein